MLLHASFSAHHYLHMSPQPNLTINGGDTEKGGYSYNEQARNIGRRRRALLKKVTVNCVYGITLSTINPLYINYWSLNLFFGCFGTD